MQWRSLRLIPNPESLTPTRSAAGRAGRRDLVADLQVPSHRVRHVEALERPGHIRTRFALPFAVDVDDVALLQLRANALGVPVLDAEADMADRGRHAIRGRRRRRRGAGVAACRCTRGGIA